MYLSSINYIFVHKKRYSTIQISLLFLFLCTLFLGCKIEEKQQIAVSAVMSDIAYTWPIFEHKKKIVACASVCARQIVSGLDTSLFLCSNKKWADHLVKYELTTNDLIIPVFKNTLICAVHKDQTDIPKTYEDLLHNKVRSFNIADPAHAPAGIYTKNILMQHNIWEDIVPKCVFSANARAVLLNIERSAVHCGVIWNSFLTDNKAVKKCFDVSAAEIDEIVFYLVIMKKYQHSAEVKKVISYLYTDDARKRSEKLGYTYIFNGGQL